MRPRVRIVSGSEESGAQLVAAALAVRLAQGGAQTACAAILPAADLGPERGPRLPRLLSSLGAEPMEIGWGGVTGGRMQGMPLGRGSLAAATIHPAVLAEGFTGTHKQHIREIVDRGLSGPLAPLASGEPLAALALAGMTRPATALALLASLRLARTGSYDEVVVGLPATLDARVLHDEPEALRRRIDVLDALQAVRRHAARASGLRQSDDADVFLTALASDLEDLWALLRRPGESEIYLCSRRDAASEADAGAQAAHLARHGIEIAAMLLTVPPDDPSGRPAESRPAPAGTSGARPAPDGAHVAARLLPLPPLPHAGRAARNGARTLAAALKKVGALALGEGQPSRSSDDPPATLGEEPLPSLPAFEAVIGAQALVAIVGGPSAVRRRLGLSLAHTLAERRRTTLGTRGAAGPTTRATASAPFAIAAPDAEATARSTRAAFQRAAVRLSGHTQAEREAIGGLLDLAPLPLFHSLALADALADAPIDANGSPATTVRLLDLGDEASALDAWGSLERVLGWITDFRACLACWPAAGDGPAALVAELEASLRALANLLPDPRRTFLLLCTDGSPAGVAARELARAGLLPAETLLLPAAPPPTNRRRKLTSRSGKTPSSRAQDGGSSCNR